MTELRRLWAVPVGVVVMAALVLDYQHPPQAIGVDFHTYVAAASVGLQHGWSDIYDQGLVDVVQKQLVPYLWVQPFLSPPPVAWLAAPLAALPYDVALQAWQAFVLVVLTLAVAWSAPQRGWALAIAIGAVLAPWWVLFAVGLGQVAPLIAASLLVAWRLVREDREIAAGIVLSIVLLKPNTAVLAPVALAVAGRFRLAGVWLASAAVVVAASLLTLGQHGVSAYLGELGHLPPGADQLTLHGALGISGGFAVVLRALIIGAALLTAFRLRASPGMALACGALASVLASPYLHDSDLCILVAAGWIVWNETAAVGWRALLGAVWLLALPLAAAAGMKVQLNRWPVIELALLGGLVAVAWAGMRLPTSMRLLTDEAEFAARAPA